MRSITEGQWAIVNKHNQELELALAACTGLFAYGTSKPNGPYLAIHSPPIQGGNTLPVLAMEGAMTHESFVVENGQPASILDLLDSFKQDYSPKHNVGIYLASGLRLNPTDLAIARFFVMRIRSEYELMGAELKQPTEARLAPKTGKVVLGDFYSDGTIGFFEFGKYSEINLRT